MTKESTIQPFEAGDIFAGATVLNNPDDDHAGDGRIIQYDKDLNEKGVLWVDGTTHLVGGLRFGPDNTLWAFDSHSYAVLNINTQGEQLPAKKFPSRSFSNINFAPDGTVILGEHLVGDEAGIKLPPDRPLGTTLPNLPGEDRYGDGHVFRCTTDGELVKEYATATNGGMPGFLGVCSSVLKPDGKTLIYLSEIGANLYQYDLEADKQLDDLITYPADSGDMVMCVGYQPDGQLLMIKANFRVGFFLLKLSETGEVQQEYAMPGPGWAAMGTSTDANIVLLGNFFTGTVAKFDLTTGEIVAQAETGVQRGLAGIAQFPG
jgi:hypothetical protein